MRVLAKILIVVLGVIAVFILTGLLANFLPPLPPTILLIARFAIIVLSTWIIMQVAGRIEKEIDRPR